MEMVIGKSSQIQGELNLPGDKSISHRSVIFNSIAKGTAEITNISLGQDCISTINIMRSMGVEVNLDDQDLTTVTIKGVGRTGLQEPNIVLDAGNSGTTMRLISGLLSTQPFFSVLTGDDSLRSRPMGRIISPLKQMGANINGRDGNTKAPFAIQGSLLQGIEYTMPVASAQLKSCLILAAINSTGETVLHQPALSRDHTEKMLGNMGVDIHNEGLQLTIQPFNGEFQSTDVNVPADISSAAFWIVAGLCHKQGKITLKNVGINPSRSGILDVMSAMGGNITIKNSTIVAGEEVGDIVVESSELVGVEIGGDIIPRLIDEIPIIALAACFAKGKTIIRDASDARNKESDRLSITASELTKFGADIEELDDGIIVNGVGSLNGTTCESFDDHRIAMMEAIAAILSKGQTTIKNSDCVAISYPMFWDDLSILTGDQ
ncbi:MAG: 3-phosphoshikimate 1-carboxyvinyltransferase [Dehalococcoidia bacterium]|jgi:3-phosphoshikimate 1-carboxyvinyltransferase|nr:3-phosphoshikimate 1-carboxyvinyltransferase [Dehalococcoidia bacterium]|tara:strand:- start:5560 stop:6861 length:1302 start_codon:yes stop_codon:yes gene_type:complete